LRAIFLSETALIDNNAEQFLCQQDFELRGAWRVEGEEVLAAPPVGSGIRSAGSASVDT
jgi:hypothetical protein